MRHITGVFAAAGNICWQEVMPQTRESDPFDLSEGVTLHVQLPPHSSSRDALNIVAAGLQESSDTWLQAPSSLIGDWIINLDEMASEFLQVNCLPEWFNGQKKIKADYDGTAVRFKIVSGELSSEGQITKLIVGGFLPEAETSHHFRWEYGESEVGTRTEGISITFPGLPQENRRESLARLSSLLQQEGIEWLMPEASPARDWVLNLDELKDFCSDHLQGLTWVRGQLTVIPDLYAEEYRVFDMKRQDYIVRKEPMIQFVITREELESMKVGVFISHITEEAKLAHKFKSLLKEAFGDDFTIFVSSDYESIEGGEIWFNKVVDSIKASDVVIVLLSKESVDRRWINFEAGIGLGTNAKVIPIVIRNFSKVEVGHPLAQLQVRDLHDLNDVRGILRDIEARSGRKTQLVDLESFITGIEEVVKVLPSKGILLRPVIPERWADSFPLTFELSNTGNQDVELFEIEASVPKNIINPNWSPLFDQNVVEAFDKEVYGKKYLALRYKVYEGPINLYYGEVERLLRFIPLGMSPRILKPLKFSIRRNLTDEEKAETIYYKVSAKAIKTEEQEIQIREIVGFSD